MARPHGTTGSLRPTFVPARDVSLAVRRPSAYALTVRLPGLQFKASPPKELTSRFNLPAPGRRQCLYVSLEDALAGTCVFAKQSLDAIRCGRFPLPLCEVTYRRHPFSRSYGVILPSSFSVNHSST